MNRILIRQHAMMRPVYIKWLLVVISTSTAWLGAMSFNRGPDILNDPWLSLAWIWTAPALFLAFGPHNERAGEFVLSLPLTARAVWSAHVQSVLLTSGVMFVAVLAFAHLALVGLQEITVSILAPVPDLSGPMLTWWCHGLAWWLFLVAVTLNDCPGVARVARDRAWKIRQLLALAITAAGMVGLGLLGPAAAVVPLIAAGLLLVRSFRRLPAAMIMLAREPSSAVAPRPRAELTTTAPWWRRPPTWAVVLQSTSKHPALLLLAVVFLFLVGFSLSGWNSLNEAGEHLGLIMVPMTAYMLFAMAGTPLLKLSRFDHLPLSRARLLRILVVPQLIIVLLGFGTGQLVAAGNEVNGEFVTWSNGGDKYGVLISPRYFSVTWHEPPTNVGPDGTTSTPPPWQPLGGSGPTLYKPFHVFPGASLDFCAWQLERATASIYDRAIPAEEFRDRFLYVSDDGHVGWRDDAPRIREAHPDLVPRSFPGLPPIQVLVAGLLFLGAYAVYLGTFRPGIRDWIRKSVFVILLSVLMVMYLSPFFFSIAGLGDPAALNVLIMAASDALMAWLPGGVVGLWILTFVALAVSYRFVLQRFRRAEWPPVRGGDAFGDVLG